MAFKSKLSLLFFLLFVSITLSFANQNPYFLDEQSFEDRFKTQEGFVRASRRFSHISDLHRGIDNYRLSLFEANPSTFLIPHYWDAEHVCFVVKGRGTITLVQQQNKKSYNLERGDLIRIPAGSVTYMINRDNNEKFQLVSLFQPVSTVQGEYMEFFGAAGQDPESFYSSFSDEILQAAFNIDKQRLDKLFRQQRKGVIVKASQEQIRALSRDASSSEESDPQSLKPFNLLNKRPTHSNQYGQLYEVDGNEYRPLQDLDVSLTFHNINKGAMEAPFYDTRGTNLVVVAEGRGRFEMVRPQQGSQEQEQGAHYQRVSSNLSPRTAFIIPAGYPVSIVASDDQNLQLVAFRLNSQNNQRNYLAGKNNLMKQLEKEAEELSFNMPAKEVEAIFNNQRRSVFLPGPNQRQQREEGGRGGWSIV